MHNPPKNNTPDKALVERTKRLGDLHLPEISDRLMKEGKYIDAANVAAAAEIIAALSQPQHGGLVETVRRFEKEWRDAPGPHWGDKIDWESAEALAIQLTNLTSSDSPVVGEVVIDLDKEFWESLCTASNESSWMPPDYMVNDWVSDCCRFLRTGTVEPTPTDSPVVGEDATEPVDLFGGDWSPSAMADRIDNIGDLEDDDATTLDRVAEFLRSLPTPTDTADRREAMKAVIRRARETAIRPIGTKDGRAQYCNDIDAAILDDLIAASLIAGPPEGFVDDLRIRVLTLLETLKASDFANAGIGKAYADEAAEIVAMIAARPGEPA